MPTAKEVFYVEIPASDSTDTELQAVLAALAANGPASALCLAHPAVQSTLTSALAVAQSWTADGDAIAAGVAALATNRKSRRANRKLLSQKLTLLRGQIQDAATTAVEAQATGAGVRYENAPPAQLLVPAGGTLTASKVVKGQFRANAAAVPGIRTFAMQISPDPVTATSWVLADGTAKRRTFSGYASGTRLWVRFASTRGHAQSAWSVPVSIDIP